jgi:hypothetical protein
MPPKGRRLINAKAKGAVAGVSGLFAAGLANSLLLEWGSVAGRAAVCGAVAVVIGGLVLALLPRDPPDRKP